MISSFGGENSLRGADFDSSAPEALRALPPRVRNKRMRLVSNAVLPLEKRLLYSSTLFTPGDLAVEVLGSNGGSTSTTAAAPVSIQEFNTFSQGQSPVMQINLPSGSATTTNNLTDYFGSTGYMTRSTDGTTLVLTGYNAASGVASTNVTTTSQTSPSPNVRVVGTVTANGTVDTSTSFGGASAPTLNQQVHGVASNDGNEFWVAGGGAAGSISGLLYVTSKGATTATQVTVNATGNPVFFRSAGFFGGQLYVDGSSNPVFGVATVGNINAGASEPTTSGQPAYVLPAMGGNPGNGTSFVFLNSTTLYNADPPGNSAPGGMQKWLFQGDRWVLAYGGVDTQAPASSISGDNSLQGLCIGPNGVLYATTSATTQNRLLQIVDTGSGFTFTTLATAPPGEEFRGVSMTPAGAGITGIAATPSTIGTGGTITLTATAAPTETANLLGSAGTQPYNYASGSVSSVSFFEQPTANASAGTQSTSDLFLGNGTYDAGTGTWTLANVTPTLSGVGTYSFYAVATESGGDGLFPNAVTGSGAGTHSGVGTGIGYEPTASVVYNTNPVPAVTSVSLNTSTSVISGTVAITAIGVSPAPGETGTTSVLFDAVGGGKTYYLGSANASTGYTLTYSPDNYAIASSSGNILSGLPLGNGYNIVAIANSSAGALSAPATAFSALSVTGPVINFNQSSYTVASNQTTGSVTLYAIRTTDISDPASVAWQTSNGGASPAQTNASAGVFFGTNSIGTQPNGVATFAAGSNLSSAIIIPILPTPSNQVSTGVFQVAFTSSNVSAGAISATAASLGSTSSVKVNILVSAETFNFSSPVVTVNATNDSTGMIYFSVTRTGYLGDGVSLNVSTSSLSSSTAAAMVVNSAGTGVGFAGVAGTDFTSLTNYSLTFLPNQAVATFPVSLPTTSNANYSFGVSISGIQGGLNSTTNGSSYTITTGQNTSIGTVLSPVIGSALVSKPGTATDVEIASQYGAIPFPLVGDQSGSGNFGFSNYQVLEFSPTTTPNIYPPVGTNLSAGSSITSLSLSLYNTDNTPGDQYNGHVGEFNVYFISASSTSQPTGGLTFSNNSSSSPTGFTLSTANTSSNAFYLGSFSFSNQLGYDTFSVLRGAGTNTSTGNFVTAAFNSVTSALNTGSNFRIVITPANQGFGATDVEWSGLSQGNPPLLSINATTHLTASPEYFSFSQPNYTVNQNVGTATITIIRSQTPGGAPFAFPDSNATVFFNTSGGTAIVGTDYNASSSTVTFPAGASSETVTVMIDPNGQVVTQGGDKLVNLSLSSPTNGSTGGYATGLGTNSSATLTIQDNKDAPGQNTSFENLTYYSDVSSVIEPQGPFDINHFSPVGSTPGAGTFTGYGAASFNDGGIVQIGANSVSNTVNPANPIKAVNNITLEVYNLGGGTSGPINIYFFNNSNSNIVPSTLPAAGSYYDPAHFKHPDPHFFNYLYTEGLDPNPADQQSFGTPLLLGTINWNSSTPVGFFPLTLSGFSLSTQAILINDLNSGAAFQIAATPGSSTVAAAWGGSGAFTTDTNGNIVTESPILSFNVTEGLPAWLKPNSVATWNASTHSLVVSGPSTIIANPGSDNPNITFTGSGDVLTINTPSASQIDIGSLALSNGAKIQVVAPSTGNDVLIVAATNVSAGTFGFTTDGTGQIDLGTSDMVLQGGSLAAVNNAVTSGYSNGTWNGNGIVSTAAKNDPTLLTSLAVIVNDNGSGSPLYGNNGTLASTFDDGFAPADGDILVKYTYYGDANIDGKVDGSDYSRVDASYASENFINGVPTNQISGWYMGDFNYDGIVNGSDYTLLDNAFNQQGPTFTPTALLAPLAVPTAMVAPATPVSDPFFSKKKLNSSLIGDVEDLITD